MKVVETVEKICEFILAAFGGAAIMAVVAFMGYSLIAMVANPISPQEEACFMALEVSSCVRTQCPTVDSCSIEEHELVWQECHEECVAQ